MFKHYLLLAVWSLSVPAFAQSAPAIEWQKSLGGAGVEEAAYIEQTSDGGYVVVGSTQPPNGQPRDYFIVKVDGDGNSEWQRQYGGTAEDKATSVRQTADGGYIVLGYSNSSNGDVTGAHGQMDVWLLKLDVSGFLQWQRTLGGSDYDTGLSVQLTSDGGYILSAHSGSSDGDVASNHGGIDYWVVKVDGAGVIEWERSFGGSADDIAGGIMPTDDGGYIVVGSTQSSNGDVTGGHGGWDAWIIKLDEDGNLEWQKALGGSGDEGAGSIMPTSDGGFILAGSADSNDGDVTGVHGTFADAWVVKVDGGGGLLWQKALGGTGIDAAGSIGATTDGGYFLSGYTSSSNGDVTGNHGGFYDYWVFKVDGSGSLQWQKALGGATDDRAANSKQTDDGGYVVTGISNSLNGDVTDNHGMYDFWVVKLEADPNSIPEVLAEPAVTLFPNPVDNDLVINYTLAVPARVQLHLFSADGRSVSTLMDERRPGGIQTSSVSLDGFAAGTYSLRFMVDGRGTTREVVIAK